MISTPTGSLTQTSSLVAVIPYNDRLHKSHLLKDDDDYKTCIPSAGLSCAFLAYLYAKSE